MDPKQLAGYIARIRSLPSHEQAEILEALDAIEAARHREACRDNFLPFVKAMWPGFIEGRHHEIMADAFERVANGKLKRLIINMPPRHTKSEFASYLLPAWFFGRFPGKKIIQCSNTADLAVGFGRKVRNLVGSETYQTVFQGLGLRADSKAAGRWSTTQDGEYFAIGVDGTVTGKGADLLIIDDPHSEQEAKIAETNPEIFDGVHDWYTSGPRQRLQPGAAILLVMTRWSKRDLAGQILKHATERDGTDEWEVIELPAIMPSGEPLWPGFWSLAELMKLKAELPLSKWNAQYQQTPTAEEGALVKREWWNRWDKPKQPRTEFIIQSWDTAFLKTQRSDYSACTTWGVFQREDEETGRKIFNIILLDAFKERMEFPELKKVAWEMYMRWQPDAAIVEKKASGAPLIFELRQLGIPVAEFMPVNDKISRVNSVTDLFASGMVWAPSTPFADEVIEEFASFPAGEHDDLVDSSVQALLRFRQGGFVRLPTDEEDEPKAPRRGRMY